MSLYCEGVVKMKKFSKKVVLIGDGSVGSSYAFAMVTQGIADEFVIIDIAKDKVEADVKDLNHGALYSASPVVVKAGEYSCLLYTSPSPRD